MRHIYLAAAATMLAVVALAHGESVQARATLGPPPGWLAAPAYRRLFAPIGARAAAYRTYVSPLALEQVLTRLADDALVLRPPGGWIQVAELPGDAFGRTGGYDRSKVARLYGAKRANVARGARGTDGHAGEAWTLVSPYPDPTLQRLEPGTLAIVLDLADD